MKLGAESSGKLAGKLEKRRKDAGLAYSELAAIAGVDASQVSRICRGQFRTLTGNVLQICTALNIDPYASEPEREPLSAEKLVEMNLKEKVTESALAMWDKTPEGADRLVRLFNDLVDLAGRQSPSS